MTPTTLPAHLTHPIAGPLAQEGMRALREGYEPRRIAFVYEDGRIVVANDCGGQTWRTHRCTLDLDDPATRYLVARWLYRALGGVLTEENDVGAVLSEGRISLHLHSLTGKAIQGMAKTIALPRALTLAGALAWAAQEVTRG